MTGADFARRRKAAKLTQAALAAALDVSRITVANWERDRYPVPAMAALALAALAIRKHGIGGRP